MPEMRSRAGSVPSSARSFTTPKGGAKEPTKFLRPNALIAFLTPMPASFCPSTVLGIRIRRTPRCAVAAA